MRGTSDAECTATPPYNQASAVGQALNQPSAVDLISLSFPPGEGRAIVTLGIPTSLARTLYDALALYFERPEERQEERDARGRKAWGEAQLLAKERFRIGGPAHRQGTYLREKLESALALHHAGKKGKARADAVAGIVKQLAADHGMSPATVSHMISFARQVDRRDRKEEVWGLYLSGKTNGEIAAKVGLSAGRVATLLRGLIEQRDRQRVGTSGQDLEGEL